MECGGRRIGYNRRAMSKEVGIGLIGAGFMAAQHWRAYAKTPGARVVALCNPSGRNLDGDLSRVGGNVGGPDEGRFDLSGVRVTRDPAELWNDPAVQLVDVCAPTSAHVSLAIGAMGAGKSVLVEKPMARTSRDAQILADAARSLPPGVYLMPAMCVRFWPEYAWARRAVKDGIYGRTLNARFRRVGEAPAWGRKHFLDGAASGGALFDLHIHDVDFALACFGLPAQVFARGQSLVSGAIDHVAALSLYPDGPVVSTEGSWTMASGFGFAMSFTISFERATLDFDSSRTDRPFRVHSLDPCPWPLPEGDDGYVGELRHIVEAIRNCRRPTEVRPEDAVAALAVCEAEERSIHSGQPETICLP